MKKGSKRAVKKMLLLTISIKPLKKENFNCSDKSPLIQFSLLFMRTEYSKTKLERTKTHNRSKSNKITFLRQKRQQFKEKVIPWLQSQTAILLKTKTKMQRESNNFKNYQISAKYRPFPKKRKKKKSQQNMQKQNKSLKTKVKLLQFPLNSTKKFSLIVSNQIQKSFQCLKHQKNREADHN